MSIRDPVDPQGRTVSDDKTGYAVYGGHLRIDGDRFELDLTLDEVSVVKRAVEWDDETSKGLVETVESRRKDPVGFNGCTYRGDYAALQQIIEALNRYEKTPGGAGLGEDKIAYDARTAFNHAAPAVKRALVRKENLEEMFDD